MKREVSNRTIALPTATVAALRRDQNRQDEERAFATDRWQQTAYVFATRIGTTDGAPEPAT
jgi:hypothetical protein